ncbi:hypothetical protein HO173_008975 [Letharia columbiana]|uniref:M protein repeat protein n=1 Tax=Letharia columbiana TaxID=112416 RepID=A0A8H6L251_9LECA|nr:uncharacterized protein HO173_008975 [Letharia columbiana]KAF6232761.1 hypothetical protein HO173_008975 [Letharia columbiana]
MADVEEKEKAEKLAAAKKKYEQLRKQKGKAQKPSGIKKKDDTQEVREEAAAPGTTEQGEDTPEQDKSGTDGGNDESSMALPDTTDAALLDKVTDDAPETPAQNLAHNRQPSLSIQSKMRSSSFRRQSLSQGPLSPSANGTKSPELPTLTSDGDSINSIYRKQAARLDELEKENRRLAKEAQENEKRWRKTEDELEELREASGDVAQLKARAEKADAQVEDFNKVKQENTSLQRQNSQLQSQSSKRHVSSPSVVATSSSPVSSLQTQLDSKSSTIESMEMEISNLRSQLDKSASSTNTHSEQVLALEEKLERAERAAGAAQRELSDVKKSLERASEKAVKEGGERTSNETKIRSLGREAEESKRNAEESLQRVDTLEKKLAALTNLHKDSDGRRQAGERERERLEKEASEMRRRLAGLENENLRLREERERARKREASGADDEGVDELEDEERRRLEGKVRSLEGEVYDLRRGVWREKRRELGSVDGDDGPASPGSRFDDVDLSGGTPSYRRQSTAGPRGSSFQTVLSSGFSALTGGAARDSLETFEDEDEFDEDAFRLAQEEEARKRVERVREVKRGLKDWEGWRMDIVDVRAGGGGAGDIFDI